MYIYVYQCIYIFFFAFFSIMVYYRISNIVLDTMPCCLSVVPFFYFWATPQGLWDFA